MKVLLCLALLVGAVWYYAVSRGRLTVRAYTYLNALASGNTEEANQLARRVDSYAAGRMSEIAMDHVKYAYAGNQSAMISRARLKGFRAYLRPRTGAHICSLSGLYLPALPVPFAKQKPLEQSGVIASTGAGGAVAGSCLASGSPCPGSDGRVTAHGAMSSTAQPRRSTSTRHPEWCASVRGVPG